MLLVSSRHPIITVYTLSLDKEVVASHLLGLRKTHSRKDSRSDITKDTALLLEAPALRSVGHDEGDLVGSMGGLGLAVRELHLLSVTVVGGNEEDVTLLLAALENLANGLVGSSATHDGGLVDTGVANHVGRSKVVHDEGKLLLTETLDDLVSNTIGAHLRSLVVSGDALVRGNEILGLVADLEREDLLNTTVEEEGDVSILLGLSNVDLLDTLLAEPLGENVAHVLGLEGNLEGIVELVLGHGDKLDVGEGEVGKGRAVDITHELSDLADAIGTVVEEEDGIVLLDAALITTDNDGLEEFVVLALLVALLDRRNGVGAGLTLAEVQALEGNLDTLPSLITIHGIVTADNGGKLTSANLLDGLKELLHVTSAGLGVGVATIAEEVDEDLGDASLLGGPEEGIEMCLLGVLSNVDVSNRGDICQNHK